MFTRTLLAPLLLTLFVCVATQEPRPCPRSEVKVKCTLPESPDQFIVSPECEVVCEASPDDGPWDTFTYPDDEPLPEGKKQVGQLQKIVKKLIDPCNIRVQWVPLKNFTLEERNSHTQHYIDELMKKMPRLAYVASNLFRDIMNYERDSLYSNPYEEYCIVVIRNRSLTTKIPVANDVREQLPVNVLRQFYESLLSHTAQMQYVMEKFFDVIRDPRLVTCHRNESQFDSMVWSTSLLADEMVDLMCTLRNLIFSLPGGDMENENDDITVFNTRVLIEEVEDIFMGNNSDCNARQFRDCTVVFSSERLLSQLLEYVSNNLRISNFEC